MLGAEIKTLLCPESESWLLALAVVLFLLAFGATSVCIKTPNGFSCRCDSFNVGIINKKRYTGILG